MILDTKTLIAANAAAQSIGVPTHHLLAVVEVESNGVVSAKVSGVDEPVVRFEGHYFYRHIVPMKRDEAVRKGLASQKAGVVKNPRTQQDRWDKLIAPAAMLDKQAAYESVSWGVGQVMGAHWKRLGYGSVLALVDHARRGVAGQIELMVRFIKADPNLQKALARGDWATFAKGYNGAGYKKNKYDTKMRDAAAKWKRIVIPEEQPAKKDVVVIEEYEEAPPAVETPPPASEKKKAKAYLVVFFGWVAVIAFEFWDKLTNGVCNITGFFCGG